MTISLHQFVHQPRLLGAVLLRSVREKVADTARVAPLVVVPGNELNKVLVEGNAGLGVEDGRVLGTDEVGRDDLVLGVADDALELTLRGGLDSSLDLVVASLLLEAADEIDDGDIEGGDTESETSKLAVELGNDLADGLGGTGGGGDDVVVDGATTTPVLVRRAVDGLLGCGRRVDGGHETLNDTKLVVDNLGEGRKAVGRAGRVGDDSVLGIVCVKVDTADEHGGIRRRSGDDDLLGTALKMSGRLVDRGEDTSCLDNVVSARLRPRDAGRVLLGVDGDGLAINDELAVLDLNGALEATVDGVILEHVDHVVQSNEGVVHGDNLDISVEESIAENNAADTTKAMRRKTRKAITISFYAFPISSEHVHTR